MPKLYTLKSRAKRILTVQLPASLASPRFPAQTQTVYRTRRVPKSDERVVRGEAHRFPPTMTILPGEALDNLPQTIAELPAVRALALGRELVIIEQTPAPAPTRAPSTRRVRRRKD